MAETAPRSRLSQDEAIALGLAVVGHVALALVLIYLKPAETPLPPPERMSVTISDEAALTSTSPEPMADPAPDKGPELGDMPPLPAPLEVTKPEPQVQPMPVPAPPRPAPVPAPRVAAKPPPKPAATPPKAAQRAAAPTTPPRPGTKPGASRFDQAFGQGVPGAKPSGKSPNTPATATGPQKSSWSSLIGNKVQRFWNSCSVSGLDVEKLRVEVRFTLAPDGSIASISDPVVLPETITPANRAQVAPFKACAVRSIKLAAPFSGLPPEYHNDWKLRVLRLRKQ